MEWIIGSLGSCVVVLFILVWILIRQQSRDRIRHSLLIDVHRGRLDILTKKQEASPALHKMVRTLSDRVDVLTSQMEAFDERMVNFREWMDNFNKLTKIQNEEIDGLKTKVKELEDGNSCDCGDDSVLRGVRSSGDRSGKTKKKKRSPRKSDRQTDRERTENVEQD